MTTAQLLNNKSHHHTELRKSDPPMGAAYNQWSRNINSLERIREKLN